MKFDFPYPRQAKQILMIVAIVMVAHSLTSSFDLINRVLDGNINFYVLRESKIVQAFLAGLLIWFIASRIRFMPFGKEGVPENSPTEAIDINQLKYFFLAMLGIYYVINVVEAFTYTSVGILFELKFTKYTAAAFISWVLKLAVAYILIFRGKQLCKFFGI